MDKHVFDKEHSCVLAKVLVIITGTKLLVYYLVFVCQLMNDVTMASFDIYKLLLFSFPWRPGDLLSWVCYPERMSVLVLQLLYLPKKSKVCSVITTACFVKTDM